ncbi:hypothetical protein CIHG_02161 [Coccidioides immitis H538.4]|uniref:Uncharacterized protein n=3 Tax=Coccidioides immitis TaxID=5501 RepID=A0A0J8U4D1_COCIT|nr:hypothetical protein CIRG_00333 [Coccidioides immitis RMSCC 2394]KMU81722.1 hypothetical protein CISG_02740 [Coccidioides immitis RMSCC 3703]KMU84376.1 hypothetical protein CIHG_02161 [Coccidioides immitis H538.4]
MEKGRRRAWRLREVGFYMKRGPSGGEGPPSDSRSPSSTRGEQMGEGFFPPTQGRKAVKAAFPFGVGLAGAAFLQLAGTPTSLSTERASPAHVGSDACWAGSRRQEMPSLARLNRQSLHPEAASEHVGNSCCGFPPAFARWEGRVFMDNGGVLCNPAFNKRSVFSAGRQLTAAAS